MIYSGIALDQGRTSILLGVFRCFIQCEAVITGVRAVIHLRHSILLTYDTLALDTPYFAGGFPGEFMTIPNLLIFLSRYLKSLLDVIIFICSLVYGPSLFMFG